MSHYEPGKEYFLKATVRDICPGGQYRLSLTVPVSSSLLKGECTEIYVANEPGLLLTASEVATTVNGDGLCKELAAENAAHIETIRKQGKDIENLERAIEELQKERGALEEANEVLRNQKGGLLQQIEKHEKTIEERTIECNRWEGMYEKVSQKCDELRGELASVKQDRDNMKENFDTALKNLADTGKTCDVFKRQRDEALKDKDDLQKALEALDKDIDGYRATIQKLSSIIGFLCGTKGGQNG